MLEADCQPLQTLSGVDHWAKRGCGAHSRPRFRPDHETPRVRAGAGHRLTPPVSRDFSQKRSRKLDRTTIAPGSSGSSGRRPQPRSLAPYEPEWRPPRWPQHPGRVAALAARCAASSHEALTSCARSLRGPARTRSRGRDLLHQNGAHDGVGSPSLGFWSVGRAERCLVLASEVRVVGSDAARGARRCESVRCCSTQVQIRLRDGDQRCLSAETQRCGHSARKAHLGAMGCFGFGRRTHGPPKILPSRR